METLVTSPQDLLAQCSVRATSSIPEPAAFAAEDLAIEPTMPTGKHGALPGRRREPRGCLGMVHKIKPISGAVIQLPQAMFSQVYETLQRAAWTTPSSVDLLFLQ